MTRLRAYKKMCERFLTLPLPFWKDTVMTNELFTGLGKKHLMAELDGLCNLAAFEQFGVFLEETV